MGEWRICEKVIKKLNNSKRKIQSAKPQLKM